MQRSKKNVKCKETRERNEKSNDLKALLAPRIKQIDAALANYLDDAEHAGLKKAMKHLPMAGGKRLRPIVAMLVADAIAGKGKKTIPFGVALEIIHNFTLVHDDIMDGDNLRRGIKTVHFQWDLPTAINAGDALFARAFEVLTEVDLPKDELADIVRDVARMTRKIAEGQQWDMDFERRRDVTEEEYIKMIEYKTAVIFECAARYGAVIARATKKQVDAMAEYGRLLGIGFQIWDDYLDLKGDQATIGKPVGSDIKRGKNTLIVVHAMKYTKPSDRKKLLAALGNAKVSQKDLDEVVKILECAGSIEYAGKKALGFAKRGKQLLEMLPDSEAKGTLGALIDYMVRREK